MYDTIEEAVQKLGNSTVLFDGVPVHVWEGGGKKNAVTLTYSYLPITKHKVPPKEEASIDDPRWDFKSLGSKLGYINVDVSPFDGKKEAVFVTRIPARTSRQGLDSRTSKIMQFPQNVSPWQWENLLSHQGLVTTVKAQFPTPVEATKLLWDNPSDIRSVAIARKMMMIYDRVTPPTLVYRNEKVGYTEDGETFKLAEHKKFLQEELVDMYNMKIK